MRKDILKNCGRVEEIFRKYEGADSGYCLMGMEVLLRDIQMSCMYRRSEKWKFKEEIGMRGGKATGQRKWEWLCRVMVWCDEQISLVYPIFRKNY